MLSLNDWPLFLLLGGAMWTSVAAGKLTWGAALTGGVLGLALYLGSGYAGVLLVGLFFLLGVAATSWKMGAKQGLGLAEGGKGRRRAVQVLANAGLAALLSFLVVFFPRQVELLQLMMASAMSSATADTLSSELGNVYGKRFYNILTFRPDERGRDGVISHEGTLAGLAGSIFIGTFYGIAWGWNPGVVWVIMGGTAGNLTDSLLGASLERRRYLDNEAVNFLNTLAGAAVGALLYLLV